MPLPAKAAPFVIKIFQSPAGCIMMNYGQSSEPYCNIDYRQRSKTLQPIRGGSTYAQFMINRFFTSQMTPAESERGNYANVPPAHHHHHRQDEILLMQHHHPSPSRQHQHLHSRSQSQHYYNTACQQVNDLNNYYNLGTGTPMITNEAQPPPSVHNHVRPLDQIAIMQVCNELGYLDSPPPMPNARSYTISGSRESGLFKIGFPQRRFIKCQFRDPASSIPYPPGTTFSVLGPSKEDRTKLSVCFNDRVMDLPHNITQAP